MTDQNWFVIFNVNCHFQYSSHSFFAANIRLDINMLCKTLSLCDAGMYQQLMVCFKS